MANVYAGVVRVSFVGARRGDRFHADEEQLGDIQRGVAAIPGAQLHILPPELDVSGGLPLEQRPSLLAAVEGVERGEYAGVIVSYLSRLGRSVREQLRAWDRVEAAGGRIVVVREGIDTSTPSGRLHRTILLAIAENEREVAAERFEERARLATEAGIWQRRQTPLGYDRDTGTRRLVVNDKADLVRWAFRARAAGMPYTRIAERMEMTPSGIRALLRNRVYLGELRVRSYVKAGAHPALVTVDEWEAAQTQASRPPRASRFDGPALLAGIVRCAGCGHVMGRSTNATVVYSCRGSSSAGRCPAPAAVTARLLDEYVAVIARHELGRLNVSATGVNVDVDEGRDRVHNAERELAAYLNGVSAADVGAEAFGTGARKRRDAVDAARDELRRRLSMRPMAPEFGTGADAWDALDAHGRNVLLRALLEVVIVRRSGGRGSRTPLRERVRVIAHGTGLPIPCKRGGEPLGVHPLAFPDLNDEGVLRVPVAEDDLEGAGG